MPGQKLAGCLKTGRGCQNRFRRPKRGGSKNKGSEKHGSIEEAPLEGLRGAGSVLN